MSIAQTYATPGGVSHLYDPTRTESVRRPKEGDFLARKLVREYRGLPDGVQHHAQLLHTLKAAFPRLSLSHTALRLYDYLFNMTGAQDWHRDRLALVWPSNERIMADLAIADVSHLKKLMRQLRGLGLIDYKDSPTRKRYGRRHPDRTIDYDRSFGIVLNSIAGLYTDLKRLADECAVRARYVQVVRKAVSASRRERDDLLTAASVLMERPAFEARRAIFDGLDAEIAESGRDYALKEDILERYRIALDTMIAELAHEAESPLGELAAFSDDELERMKSFGQNKPPTGGRSGPSNRNITAAAPSPSNRLSDQGSGGETTDSRDLGRAGQPLGGAEQNDGGGEDTTSGGSGVAGGQQSGSGAVGKAEAANAANSGALARRMAKIRAMGEAAEAAKPGPVVKHVLEPAKISLAQVRAALPPVVAMRIRADWGFYQIYDHLRDAAAEVGVSVLVLDEARLLMGPDRACACAAVLIAKAGEIRKKDAYLRGLMEKYRQGGLHIERSLFGIIKRRRENRPETRKLPL